MVKRIKRLFLNLILNSKRGMTAWEFILAAIIVIIFFVIMLFGISYASGHQFNIGELIKEFWRSLGR